MHITVQQTVLSFYINKHSLYI